MNPTQQPSRAQFPFSSSGPTWPPSLPFSPAQNLSPAQTRTGPGHFFPSFPSRAAQPDHSLPVAHPSPRAPRPLPPRALAHSHPPATGPRASDAPPTPGSPASPPPSADGLTPLVIPSPAPRAHNRNAEISGELPVQGPHAEVPGVPSLKRPVTPAPSSHPQRRPEP